jgi:hypothetical protein
MNIDEFFIAIKLHDYKIIKRMLEINHNLANSVAVAPTAFPRATTALLFSISLLDLKIIKLLLKYGADPNASGPVNQHNDKPPYIQAMSHLYNKNNNTDDIISTIKELVKYGAIIRKTPLFLQIINKTCYMKFIYFALKNKFINIDDLNNDCMIIYEDWRNIYRTNKMNTLIVLGRSFPPEISRHIVKEYLSDDI